MSGLTIDAIRARLTDQVMEKALADFVSWGWPRRHVRIAAVRNDIMLALAADPPAAPEPVKTEGIPYSIEELELAAEQPNDPYHRELMRWAATKLKEPAAPSDRGGTDAAAWQIHCCPATEGPGFSLLCTLYRGHDGPHVATTTTGKVIGTWPAPSSAPPSAQGE